MAEYEKIKGAAIPKLFKELLHHKALLKLTLVDTDYEHLTLITALADRNNARHFVIDAREDLKQAATEADSWQLHFEFTGKDRIKYSFTTTGAEIDGHRIYVKYPREIERWQRREVFRLNAPAGTRLCLTQHAARLELNVINISIGGTLAALVRTGPHKPKKAPFADNQLLKDIELAFPPEIMRQPIRIKNVQVKRLKKNSEETGYEVALEFYEISTDEEKRLTDLIYRLQRQKLRHRLPLDI